MKTAFKLLFHSTLIAGLAFGAGACELQDCPDEGDTNQDGGTEDVQEGECIVGKSLDRFHVDRVENGAWSSGMDVTIESVNGKISVITGQDSSTVAVTFRAFVYRAFDTPQDEARANIESRVTTEVTTTADSVAVRSSRSTNNGSPGAEITVELPQGFDGDLIIDQNNGAIDVDYVGTAPRVVIDSDNGSIDANTGSSPSVSITNTGAGSVEVGASSVNAIDVTGRTGGVTVSIGAVEDGATGGAFTVTRLGDIELNLPSSGAFSLQAQAGEAVDFGSIPTECSEEVAAESSKTLTCNGGGTNFTADATDSGLNSIVVAYN